MRRVALGEPAVLTLAIYDDDGDLVDATGSVTWEIEDGDGTTVAFGSATQVQSGLTATPVTGTYQFTLPSTATDALDTYTVTWSATVATIARTFTSRYEVVGAHYFDIQDLRSFSESIAENPSRYSGARIREARDTAAERLEHECYLSFVPRLARRTVTGSGRRLLLLPHNAVTAVYSVAIDGEELTQEQVEALRVEDYGLTAEDGDVWPQGVDVSVVYQHGLDFPEDSVRRAAMILAVDYLVPAAIPARALSESTDIGTIRYSVAGRDGATGIPEVDAVIARYGRRTPTVV